LNFFTHALAISFFERERRHWNRGVGNDSWSNGITFTNTQFNSNQSPPPTIRQNMYIDKIPKQYNGKVHTQYLLRTSKREGQKIIKTTLLNLTGFGKDTCEAMIYVLKNKKSIARLIETKQPIDLVQPLQNQNSTTDLSPDIYPVLRQSPSIGAVWLLSRLANRLGITDALGNSREGRLALWQVLARTIDQGSRLSATRLARTHEVDFLELQNFNENSSDTNLDRLVEHKRAKPDTALNSCNDKLKRLKLDGWIELRLLTEKREIELTEDSAKLKELSRLDGGNCKTNAKITDKNSVPQNSSFIQKNATLKHTIPLWQELFLVFCLSVCFKEEFLIHKMPR
jgi:hypothetical protein